MSFVYVPESRETWENLVLMEDPLDAVELTDEDLQAVTGAWAGHHQKHQEHHRHHWCHWHPWKRWRHLRWDWDWHWEGWSKN